MNLLWDSARKCIDIAEWFKENQATTGWRKSKSWRRSIKSHFRTSSTVSRSGGKNKQERLTKATTDYLKLCRNLSVKVQFLQTQINNTTQTISSLSKSIELEYFHKMLVKHIDLVERRIIKQEVIPSSEKLYSIFETHAEWLSKGKQFTPVEIGHNVLIATDQFNFIVHHQVAQKQMDVQLTKGMATTLTQKFPNQIESLSFDKGFYSKENKEFVQQIIPQTVMPKKGKRNQQETQQEHQQRFIQLRNAHNAVESNIHQLQHNGLNQCPDKGIKNFKRYTALSVLAISIS